MTKPNAFAKTRQATEAADVRFVKAASNVSFPLADHSVCSLLSVRNSQPSGDDLQFCRRSDGMRDWLETFWSSLRLLFHESSASVHRRKSD
jgi:hypothetical protein